MLGVIISAITVIMLGYLMVGFAGYLAFPTTVEGNVLKSFPEKSILIQVWPPHFLCSPISQQLFGNISGRGPCMRMASMRFVLAVHCGCYRFLGLANASSFLLHCHLLLWLWQSSPTNMLFAACISSLMARHSLPICTVQTWQRLILPAVITLMVVRALRTALQIARGVIGAVVTGHYPLNHHPARLAMEHLEQFCFGWKDISVAFSAFQSIIFIVSTIAVANVVRTWRCV